MLGSSSLQYYGVWGTAFDKLTTAMSIREGKFLVQAVNQGMVNSRFKKMNEKGSSWWLR